MKDFERLIQECLGEVTAVGITPGNIVQWKINTRAKTRWGLCTKKTNGECTIEIAAVLLQDDRISEKSCKETIIHEILHTCRECKGHTGYWKQYATLMNEAYGYNIKRVTQGEEKGVENYKGSELPVKYIFQCKNCQAFVYRKRESNFTRHYKRYGCAKCGALRSFIRIN